MQLELAIQRAARKGRLTAELEAWLRATGRSHLADKIDRVLRTPPQNLIKESILSLSKAGWQ